MAAPNEFLTFALAVAGYAGLTASVVSPVRRPVPPWLWRLTAAVIVTHVALVWAWRYQWQFAVATRNGYAGFLIFHTALLLVVGSLFMTGRRARLAMRIAFLAVTVGAVGAVFRYDEVAMYRVPVIVLACTGIASLGRMLARTSTGHPFLRRTHADAGRR